MPAPRLLIATRNPGKMREYRRLLEETPFDLVSLDDLAVTEEVEETGHTFRENAALKARTYGALAGVLTLADDSGLEVDALGGEPGVYSSRYGTGPTAAAVRDGGAGPESDEERVDLLLRNLEGVPWQRRTARFHCVLTIAAPRPTAGPSSQRFGAQIFRDGLAAVVGSVAGMIQYEPQGSEGFGYDPVFYLPSYGVTMAQIPLDEKNRISHRGHAAGQAVALLQRLAQPATGLPEQAR